MDPLDCLVTHCVVLAAWDDQADVEDPEEDLTCSCWRSWIRHGMVRLIRWLLCQVVEVHP